MPRPKGLAAVFLAAFLWSATGILARYAAFSLDPLVVAAVKTVFSAAILACVSGRTVFQTRPSELQAMVLPGMAYGAMSVFFILAAAHTTIANTYFFLYSEPIFVAILSFLLFKKRIPAKVTASIALVIAGLFLLFSPSSSSGTFFGNACALAAGLVYAVYIIGCERAGSKHAPGIVTFWSFVFGFLFLGAVTSFLHLSAMLTVTVTASAIKAAFPFIILYAFIDAVAYLCLNRGLKLVEASVAGTVLASEPIIAVALGYLFFGETVGAVSALGAALVLSGVLNAGRKA